MASALASLLVELNMNAAQFVAEAKNASKHIESLEQKATSFGHILKTGFEVLAIKEVAEKFAELVMHGAEAAEEMAKMAAAAGISREAMSSLGTVAEVTHLGFETFSKAMIKLNKSIVDSQDPASKAARAFEYLGVSAVDPTTGRARKAEEVFLDLAEAFKKVPEGPERTALALDLFSGRLGGRMIPMMLLGRDGIERLVAEMKNLGGVMSEETIEGAERFGEAMKKLDPIMTNLGASTAAALAPMAEELVNAFSEMESKTKGMVGPLEALGVVAKAVGVILWGIPTAFMFIYSSLEQLGLRIAATMAEIKVAWDEGGVKGLLFGTSGSARVRQQFEADSRALNERYQRFANAPFAKMMPSHGSGHATETEDTYSPDKKTQAEKDAEAASKRLDKIMEEMKKKIAGLKAMGFSDDKYAGEMAEFKFRVYQGDIAQDLAAKFGKDTEGLERYRKKLIETMAAEIALKKVRDEQKEGTQAFEKLEKQLEDMRLRTRNAGVEPSQRATVQYRLESGDLKELFDKATKMPLAPGESEQDRAKKLEKLKASLLEEAELYDQRIQQEKDLKEAIELRQKVMEEGAAVEKEMRTPLERYADEVERLKFLLEQGAIGQETFNRATKKARQEYDKNRDDMIGDLMKFGDALDKTLGEGLVVGFTQGFAAMGEYFTKTLQKMAAEALATNLMKLLGFGEGGLISQGFAWGASLLGLGGSGGSGNPMAFGESGIPWAPSGGEWDPLSVSWNAGGGDLWAGSPTTVGEHGPEVFVPSVAGHVMTHQELQALTRPAQRQGPSSMRVMLDPAALRMTMREWLEGELASMAATR